jgi:hypothetical protein
MLRRGACVRMQDHDRLGEASRAVDAFGHIAEKWREAQ